jgi:hypothetical protein
MRNVSWGRICITTRRHCRHGSPTWPWICRQLDASSGRARGMAESARRIGAIPQLAEALSSGRIGTDTVKVLTRTARAIEHTSRDPAATLTEMLEVAQGKGIGAAKRQVQLLEHALDPGAAEERLAKQRARSFARINELESGMCRLEALLDPERATVLRCAIDQITGAWIQARQYDGADPIPTDVRSTEQINAHALVRLAEFFLHIAPGQRDATFTPKTLYTAPLDAEEGDLAESVYGILLPRTVLAPPGHPAAHILRHDAQGQPVLLDGEKIDAAPTVRLASPAQRVALAWRDRHCTFPGCTRPTTWSLHAHHRIHHRHGGPTTLQNLSLLCSEHHTLVHQPAPGHGSRK